MSKRESSQASDPEDLLVSWVACEVMLICEIWTHPVYDTFDIMTVGNCVEDIENKFGSIVLREMTLFWVWFRYDTIKKLAPGTKFCH